MLNRAEQLRRRNRIGSVLVALIMGGVPFIVSAIQEPLSIVINSIALIGGFSIGMVVIYIQNRPGRQEKRRLAASFLYPLGLVAMLVVWIVPAEGVIAMAIAAAGVISGLMWRLGASGGAREV